MPDKISPIHWNAILQSIHDGVCVPFLGAAVNVAGDGYQPGLPLGGEVALRLVEKLVYSGPDVDMTMDAPQLVSVHPHQALVEAGLDKDLARVWLQNLPRVALHVEAGAGTPFLIQQLKELLPDHKREPSPLLRKLARLPFPLIITTNYDCLMERALEEAGKKVKVVVQPIDRFDTKKKKDMDAEILKFEDDIEKSKNEGTIVYKIHGSFERQDVLGEALAGNQVSRIVVTEDDYIEFLAVMNNPDAGVPKQIESKLVGGTLLFLGYGLEDWDLRTIFKGLIEGLPRHTRRKSFAIQKAPPEFWKDFWKKKDVEIYDHDLYQFARELDQKFNPPKGAGKGNDASPAGDSNG